MRTHVDYSSTRETVYKDFCSRHPQFKMSYIEWKKIIYEFNEMFRNYILETGEKARLPFGFGEFSITKKKRQRYFTLPDGREKINYSIDWKKTKEKEK